MTPNFQFQQHRCSDWKYVLRDNWLLCKCLKDTIWRDGWTDALGLFKELRVGVSGWAWGNSSSRVQWVLSAFRESKKFNASVCHAVRLTLTPKTNGCFNFKVDSSILSRVSLDFVNPIIYVIVWMPRWINFCRNVINWDKST